MSRSRSWCFTLNNYTDEEVEALEAKMDERVSFMVYGREVGDSGTPHLQGFIYFRHAKTQNAAKNFISPRAHVEPRRGTFTQAITYCTKEDPNFFHYGERPQDRQETGDNERRRWKRALELAMEGNIEDVMEESPDIALRYYNTLKRIKFDHMEVVDNLDGELDNWWYWGPPGTGKSLTARREHPDAYIKPRNKWWDGYAGETHCIVDEVELEDGKWLTHYIKIWGDRYSFIGEIKGGAKKMRPRGMTICSNYSIDQVFPEPQANAAVKRRFKQKHFTDLFTQFN